jgi:hypothetical protein
MEQLSIDKEILNYVLSKVKKYNQVVWIPSYEFVQIIQMSEELKIAPNQLISAIIIAFLRNKPLFVKEVEVQVEKIVEKKDLIPVCTVCLQDFDSIQNLKTHLQEHHNIREKDINNFLYEMFRKYGNRKI